MIRWSWGLSVGVLFDQTITALSQAPQATSIIIQRGGVGGGVWWVWEWGGWTMSPLRSKVGFPRCFQVVIKDPGNQARALSSMSRAACHRRHSNLSVTRTDLLSSPLVARLHGVLLPLKTWLLCILAHFLFKDTPLAACYYLGGARIKLLA